MSQSKNLAWYNQKTQELTAVRRAIRDEIHEFKMRTDEGYRLRVRITILTIAMFPAGLYSLGKLRTGAGVSATAWNLAKKRAND